MWVIYDKLLQYIEKRMPHSRSSLADVIFVMSLLIQASGTTKFLRFCLFVLDTEFINRVLRIKQT